MDKITFCIPSKSNLRYLKTCIPSIRNNAFRDDHDIIVFVDSDEDGTVDWLKLNKKKYNLKYYINPDLGKSLYGIGRAYDFCIEKSKTDVFMIFHADMMLGKNADLNAYMSLESKVVVCSTRIEPPLHPSSGEKILFDYGMWPEEFKEKEFDKFVQSKLDDEKITEGVFAPWMMLKSDFQNTPQHDPALHSCREDSDLFNTLQLLGFKFIQKWNSLVYHLAGRGAGSFSQDKDRHAFWKKQMNNSTRDFARKWGSNVHHTPLMNPIVIPKYKSLLILKNGNKDILYQLEPYYHTVSCSFDHSDYVKEENLNSSFDLNLKFTDKPEVLALNLASTINNFNLIAEVDGLSLSPQDITELQNVNYIIHTNNFIGSAKIGNQIVNVKDHNSLEKEMISEFLHEKISSIWSGG